MPEMSARLSLVLLLAVAVASTAAHPHAARRHHGGPHGGRPHLPLGPVHAVLGELSADQRHQLFASLHAAANATKAELKQKVQEFVATLSAELQSKVADAKTKFEAKRAADATKVAALSAGAQSLFADVNAALADDSLTVREEHEKIRQLVRAADAAALQELRAAHVRLPGLQRRGGRPHGRRGHHGRPLSTTAAAPAAQ
ncbi:hypothetical protein M3Y99_00133900 [Aphelenchoides fujianensis]|nr:hypothetical protein M3Y99_00133900 [Aphelenchoides fujianensis]